MKGKGLLLLGLLVIGFLIVYLNLARKKVMVKQMNTSLEVPANNAEEVPEAIKNQLEKDLIKTQEEREGAMPVE